MERFSYDREMKTREQTETTKEQKQSDLIGLLDGYKRTLAFGWLHVSERSAEKISCPRTF